MVARIDKYMCGAKPKWYFSTFCWHSLAHTWIRAGISFVVCLFRVCVAPLFCFRLVLKNRVPSGDLLSQFTIFRSRTAHEYRPCSRCCIFTYEIRTEWASGVSGETIGQWALCDVFQQQRECIYILRVHYPRRGWSTNIDRFYQTFMYAPRPCFPKVDYIKWKMCARYDSI